jgi:type I restriction enzyme S subunit
MPSINTEIMRGVKVPVPPMVEQRAIAGVLGALDDKIESNSRLICIAKGVIAAEFIRTLESAEGELRFADMFSRAERVVQTGPFGSNLHASDYKDDGVPLILVKHVLGGEIALDGLPLIGMDKVRELASYRLKTNDIVLTRVGRIGDAALVPQSQEGWLISGQMLRMRLPDGSVIPSWLNQWFLGAEFRERIAGYSVGSTRMSLSTGILMEVPFPNVSIEVQRYFDESTSPLRGLITRARAENLTLSGIRDSLLPELLSGRLRVKDAESMMENV